MKFFEELGARVDQRWKQHDYDEALFPQLATEALEATRPSDHVALIDVVEAIHGRRYSMGGAQFDNPFGQPPVTIFRTPHFVIQILFWLESTTSIHQHGFSGAFHVLEGSSIHTRYSFERTRRFSDRLLLGNLARESLEHLKKGAVRPILKDSGTIHSLFHLDHPSVSVVVRTPSAAVTEPQYGYLFPGIAYDPFYRDESLFLRQRTLRVLASMKHPRLKELAVRSIRDADAFDAFQLMLDLGASLESAEEYEALLDAVLPEHLELVEGAREATRALDRERNITRRRAAVQGTEHRFFLGVLLNARSRTDALALVEQAYPGMSPVQRIVGWAAELGRTTFRDPATGEATSLIGVPLGESELAVLGHLLTGASDDQVYARLHEEFGEDVASEREPIFELCAAFRASGLFSQILSA